MKKSTNLKIKVARKNTQKCIPINCGCYSGIDPEGHKFNHYCSIHDPYNGIGVMFTPNE